MPHLVMHLAVLSNEEVLSSLKTLIGEGNRILAKVLAYLAEVEERRIHLELACGSMFEFCIRRLGFSENEAFRRLTAARLVRRFPAIGEAGMSEKPSGQVTRPPDRRIGVVHRDASGIGSVRVPRCRCSPTGAIG